MIPIVSSSGELLGCLFRQSEFPGPTRFLTPPELTLQVGFVVSAAGAEITRHVHRPVARTIEQAAELLIVQSGRCEVDVFDQELHPVATHELRRGDMMLLVAGGHGLRMLEDTVLLEVKQGPYRGGEEKQTF